MSLKTKTSKNKQDVLSTDTGETDVTVSVSKLTYDCLIPVAGRMV